MFFTYAEHSRVFERVGIWTPATESVTGYGEPEEVPVVRVSDGLLSTLGVAPLLGRSFSAADFEPGAAPTAMLAYGYWQRRFGGEHSVIGRKITGNGVPAEIIGVMPKGFRVADTNADLLVPMQSDRSRLMLPTFDYGGIARLKPGVTMAEANADVARMLPIWLRSWPSPPGVDPSFFLGRLEHRSGVDAAQAGRSRQHRHGAVGRHGHDRDRAADRVCQPHESSPRPCAGP